MRSLRSCATRGHSHVALILLAGLLGAVMTGVLLYYPRATEPALAQSTTESTSTALAGARALENASVSVAASTLPSVVRIDVITLGRPGGPGGPGGQPGGPDLEDLFRQFRGGGPQGGPGAGQGRPQHQFRGLGLHRLGGQPG